MSEQDRFSYHPDDKLEFTSESGLLAIGIRPIPGQSSSIDVRARMRRQLGEAGYAMSDADIDALINTATGSQPGA